MIVARQAEALLSQNNPAALKAALAVLAPLKTDYPSLTYQESGHPFTECALFADTIKSMGYSWQSNWHFIDIPYYNNGYSSSFTFKAATVDLEGALTALVGMLTNTGNYQSTTYYQQIAAAFPNPADQLSFALRLVIHYVGDIHQPLHAEAEVNSTYPSGDQGGNAEKVPSVNGVSNLHSIWDSVIYNYTGNPVMPLSTTDWTWYTNTAATMSATYPVDSSNILSEDYASWASQSFDIAVNKVYPGFVTGQVPSTTYDNAGVPAVEANMMLGAARLANLIETIYGTNSLFLQ